MITTIIEFDQFIENSNKELQELVNALKEKCKYRELICTVNTIETSRQLQIVKNEIIELTDKIKQNRFLHTQVKLEFKPIILEMINSNSKTELEKDLDFIVTNFKKQYYDLYDLNHSVM